VELSIDLVSLRWVRGQGILRIGWKDADWIEQCFTSPPTQYRLYERRFLQVK